MVHPKARRADSPEDQTEDQTAPAVVGGEVVGRERAVARPPAASGLRRRPGKPGVIDACLAVVVGLAVLLVHDVPYLLHQSFWVDEAWVADTVRAPIGLTHSLGLITPLGWTFLLSRIDPKSSSYTAST